MNPRSRIACSLITICYGRDKHLRNLLIGVRKGHYHPAEIVVVVAEPIACLDEFPDLPLRPIRHALGEGGEFNVAAARNAGAAAAAYNQLVFLDVDCIPHPDFLPRLLNCPASDQALVMGDPYYLPSPLPKGWDAKTLADTAKPHPHRPIVHLPQRSEDYGMFWSLCFAVTAHLLEDLGNFDERYVGYGAEDTDLAFRARKRGVPLYLAPAVVYHQQHTVSTPPVNHFSGLIANCRVFYAEWGEWPMGNWLAGFRELGLIEWTHTSPEIVVMAQPDQELLEGCRRPHAAYA